MEGLRTAVPLEDAGEVVLLLDENGVITRASGNVEKLLGYPPNELVGKHATVIRPDVDKLVVHRKNGTTFPPDISLVPITNGDSKVFSVTLRDLRARERDEDRRKIYESLLEAAPDAIVVVDDEGLIRLANRQVEALFGYVPGELLGKSVDLLVPERARKQHPFRRTKYLKEAKTRPVGVGRKLSARRVDGTEFPVEITLSTIDTSDGLLVSAAIRDITDRIRAEERHQLFQSLLEAAPDAIVVVDAGGRISLVNRKVEELFGYTRGELIGELVEILVPENARAEHPHHRSGYMLDPRTRPMGAGLELTARCKDGTAFPVDISLSTIQTAEGLFVSAALRDVTDLRRAEARSRLAAIVDSSVDAIIGETLEGTITSWNPAAERLYGWTAAEAIGKDIAITYPPTKLDERAEILAKLRKGERISGLETVRMRRDGTLMDFLVSISPVREEHETIVGIASTGRDITDYVAAARQRERLERELQQAQRLESVGQLAGGVAHDFNNLIAVIMNYATFVADELGDRPALREDVEEIRRAAERAATLTRQLLIFSRREVAHPEILDVNSVVVEMRKLLQRTIGEHIELVSTPAAELWPVLADRGQIEQVIMNLAVNARDAMPHGGKLVIETQNAELDEDFVATRVDLPTGRYMRLIVADTGQGMTAEVADRAFEPFFTTKPKGKGTGLGLATVYGIVSDARGKVGLYSEPGRGTTVTVLLPAAETAAMMAEPSQTTGESAGNGEGVLLVEDEGAVRAAARRILTKNGYRVFEAASPADAVGLGADLSRKIDLILTDVVMPDMSGMDLVALLHKSRPGAPVLYMSGYPQDVIAHQGLVTGEVHLLEKPFTRKALLRAVREVLVSD
ncbi:MAG: PAS domain S-box protein [Chloroflexota bacterium]|nr:PAS domain S-box protein [Chloroflexota bacterium]